MAPSHFLVIPKNRMGLSGIRKATKAHIGLLGHLMYVAAHVAGTDPLLKDDGYRIVVNDGKFGCKKSYFVNLFDDICSRLINISLAFACHGRKVTFLATRCMIIKIYIQIKRS